ncbi:MAG: hypothetical protein MHM6MM_002351 [Cercozoa sp. M6MM]
MAAGHVSGGVDYLEVPCRRLADTKAFFAGVFGWKFTDFGEGYAAFSRTEGGIDGGFFQSAEDNSSRVSAGAVLPIIYSANLEETLGKVTAFGNSEILKPIFEFPGGRRFHFADPSGNEWAVWSDKPAPAPQS